jgi:hypothetical protein
VDPTNNRIVVDFNGLMTNIFGYGPGTLASHSEFVVKYVQLEKENAEKARAEGRHSSPKLCHMCKLVKPLSPKMAEDNDGGGGRQYGAICTYGHNFR